jgi:hypothetical protein
MNLDAPWACVRTPRGPDIAQQAVQLTSANISMGGKPYFGTRWNAGFRPESGPSRGDRCTRASRPIEPFAVVTRYVRSTSTPDGRWRASSGMARLFAPHCGSGPSLHAKVLTSVWVCGVTDFNRLSYAKDTCESGAPSPRTGHGNYRIRPRQHGWAVSRLPERSAQGSGSGPDLSRDGKQGEGRPPRAGARA